MSTLPTLNTWFGQGALSNSAQHRFLQFQPWINEYFLVCEHEGVMPHDAPCITDTSVVLFQNALPLWKTWWAKPVVKAANRFVIDYDEALWLSDGGFKERFTRRFRCEAAIRECERVIAANEALATYARRYRVDVDVIPYSVEVPEALPDLLPSPGMSTFTIGLWGLPSAVNALKTTLQPWFDQNPEVRVETLSDERQTGSLRSLNVLLAPCTRGQYNPLETPPMLVQALALGVPIVSNGEGAVAELVRPEFGYPVGPSDSWGDVLTLALRHLDQRTGKRQAAHAHARKHHDLASNAKRLLEVFQAVHRHGHTPRDK